MLLPRLRAGGGPVRRPTPTPARPPRRRRPRRRRARRPRRSWPWARQGARPRPEDRWSGLGTTRGTTRAAGLGDDDEGLSCPWSSSSAGCGRPGWCGGWWRWRRSVFFLRDGEVQEGGDVRERGWRFGQGREEGQRASARRGAALPTPPTPHADAAWLLARAARSNPGRERARADSPCGRRPRTRRAWCLKEGGRERTRAGGGRRGRSSLPSTALSSLALFRAPNSRPGEGAGSRKTEPGRKGGCCCPCSA